MLFSKEIDCSVVDELRGRGTWRADPLRVTAVIEVRDKEGGGEGGSGGRGRGRHVGYGNEDQVISLVCGI